MLLSSSWSQFLLSSFMERDGKTDLSLLLGRRIFLFSLGRPKSLIFLLGRTLGLFVNFPCSPYCPHPPTEAVVEVSAKLVLQQQQRKMWHYSNTGSFFNFELSRLTLSNPNQWAPEMEEARTQPASVPTVQQASQASRASHHNYRKLDWLKPCVPPCQGT